MRISAFILVVVTIIAMIYYLTGNPLIATYHLLKLNTAGTKKEKAKKIASYCAIYISIALIWNIVAPAIVCYYNQPVMHDTRVLQQMPQYSNAYVHEYKRHDNFLADASVQAYYMEQDCTKTQSTKRGIPVDYMVQESGTSILEIQYREPKQKTGIYFFMDYLTWARTPKLEHYTFLITK